MFNLFVENILDDTQCKLLIERGLQTDLQIMHSSKVVNGKVITQDVLKLDDNKRKGSYYFEDEMLEPLFTSLTDTLLELMNSLKIFNGIEYNGISKYTFNQYESGDFLNWHKDSHEIINGATTTIIIQLNDNYEGGEVMYRLNNIDYSVPKKAVVYLFLILIWNTMLI